MWWGFASIQERDSLSAVVRKLVRFGFLPKSFPTFEELCKKADQDLFRNILNNPGHILHYLLPPSVIFLTDFIIVIVTVIVNDFLF